MKMKKNINQGNYKLIRSYILRTNITKVMWQTERRITNQIVGVKGLKTSFTLIAEERFSFDCKLIDCDNYITDLQNYPYAEINPEIKLQSAANGSVKEQKLNQTRISMVMKGFARVYTFSA